MSQVQLSSLSPISYKEVPCISTEMLAQAYEVEAKQIRQNFANNKERFVEGKHFYSLSGNELREFKHNVEIFDSVKIARNVNALTLWTERGAARHAKMLNSDRAWDVFELLEETFFRVAAERPAEPVGNPDQLTPAHRSELKGIVDAKLSTYPASVQGKARSEIWARFNRHFRIAEYAQLPAERMAEARDYLIELEVKALKALPAAPSAIPAVEEDLAFIRACAREIMERERRMYFALRDTLPPLRGVTRPLALCLHESMDAGSVLLDAALKQVENTARLVLEYARG
ncbi:ORF6N domain-containing protein [uncultured Desulfovibrio sp.]|uniref:ORF6N domain-containing protein n=1 Tax=uncultured Desulfovibrio sp. TaxID=167968 RepID=UPI00272B2455|nr:ORF6N domain-containing protein [uncultured Desulfovibrio sp.]